MARALIKVCHIQITHSNNSTIGGPYSLSGHTHSTLTFNSGGNGATSGTTYNGGTARTISYNSVGAASSSHTHTLKTSSVGLANICKTNTSAGSLTAENAQSTGWKQYISLKDPTGHTASSYKGIYALFSSSNYTSPASNMYAIIFINDGYVNAGATNNSYASGPGYVFKAMTANTTYYLFPLVAVNYLASCITNVSM